MKITFVEDSGRRITVDAEPGTSLMRAAVNNGVEAIVAECGGNCACGTCRIYLDEPWLAKLPLPGPSEAEMIEYSEDAQPGVRLSCQIQLSPNMDGLEVRLPKNQY